MLDQLHHQQVLAVSVHLQQQAAVQVTELELPWLDPQLLLRRGQWAAEGRPHWQAVEQALLLMEVLVVQLLLQLLLLQQAWQLE